MFLNSRRTIVLLSSFVILVFCLSPFSNPVSAYSTPSFSSPAKLSTIHSVTAYYSTNWAGYAINASKNSVTQVKGSWTQPAVSCPSSSAEEYAVFWVGIDGLTSLTVEQTGTATFCSGGVASYYAWYEFYPAGSISIPITVTPGNVFSATVKYSTVTSKFTISIKDVTTGKSFSHSASVIGALRNSAEWIAEAPAYCNIPANCLYPLSNFGTTSFGKDTTLVTGTNTATISGSTKPIAKFGSTVDSLSMVNNADTAYKAQPSALSTDGTSFSIAWVSTGP